MRCAMTLAFEAAEERGGVQHALHGGGVEQVEGLHGRGDAPRGDVGVEQGAQAGFDGAQVRRLAPEEVHAVAEALEEAKVFDVAEVFVVGDGRAGAGACVERVEGAGKRAEALQEVVVAFVVEGEAALERRRVGGAAQVGEKLPEGAVSLLEVCRHRADVLEGAGEVGLFEGAVERMQGVLRRERPVKFADHTPVVHDVAEVLALEEAVDAGDGLKERVLRSGLAT